MDSAVEREACRQCGELVALRARVCPHCHASALVYVRLGGPVTDGRVRYQLARALAPLDASLSVLTSVQAALQAERPKLGPLTRESGLGALERLAGQGLAAQLEGADPGPPGRRSRAWVLGAVALAVLAPLAFLASRRAATGRSAEQSTSVAPSIAPHAASAPSPATLSTREIAARALPSVVVLKCGNALGSGFVVAPELVMTNAHVCPKDAAVAVELPSGKSYIGRSTHWDDRLDLALLSVPQLVAPPLPLADAGELELGDRVIVIGNPMGIDFTVHEGVVSNLKQIMMGVAYLQTDARINPGNSGGPLLDARGRVVGVVSMKRVDAEGIGWALPINYAWQQGLVAAPGPDSDAWVAMLAQAEGEDHRQAEAFEHAFDGPLLAGARVDQYHRLVALVARATNREPPLAEFTFQLQSGGVRFCTLKGDVSEWKTNARESLDKAFDPRVAAWVRAHRLDLNVFVGEVPLRWDQCPESDGRVTMELEGANPEAKALPLR
jgi:serine protease Do